VQTAYDADYYVVDEVSGTPGFVVDVDFSGVASFNKVQFRTGYSHTGHTIVIEGYDIDSSRWDSLGSFRGFDGFSTFEFGIPIDTPFIDTGGVVKTRFYHQSAGVADPGALILDYMALQYATEGPQGQEGVSGWSGYSGYSGGNFAKQINALSADVEMTNDNTYYDGPSITVTPGTWLITGSVTIQVGISGYSGAGNAIADGKHICTSKLWDGTTVYASSQDEQWSTVTVNTWPVQAATSRTQHTLAAVVTVSENTTYKISSKSSVGVANRNSATCILDHDGVANDSSGFCYIQAVAGGGASGYSGISGYSGYSGSGKSGYSGVSGYSGANGEYAIQLFSTTRNSPVDNFVWYIAGQYQTDGASGVGFVVPKSGRITAVTIQWHAATVAGSNQTISGFVGVNAAYTSVADVSNTNDIKTFANYALDIAVAAGDYINLRLNCPPWSPQNPTGVTIHGIVYIAFP
jgi:hypothetical protein